MIEGRGWVTDVLKEWPWKLVTPGFKGSKLSDEQYIIIWHAPSKSINNVNLARFCIDSRCSCLWSSDGITQYSRTGPNYCGVKCRSYWGGTPLSWAVSGNIVVCWLFTAITVMWTDHDRLASKLSPNNLNVETRSTEPADVDRCTDGQIFGCLNMANLL